MVVVVMTTMMMKTFVVHLLLVELMIFEYSKDLLLYEFDIVEEIEQ